MNRLRVLLIAFAAAALFAGCAKSAFVSPAPAHGVQTADALIAAVEGLSRDGLDPARYDLGPLRSALASGDAAEIDREARTLFFSAAAEVSAGAVAAEARKNWRMAAAGPDMTAIEAAADDAFRSGDFANAFAALAPTYDQYRRLKAALAQTPASDARTRALIALNMERWRWMPRDPGEDYIFVNAPAYELFVFRRGAAADRRRVIVGARKTPTPQIAAMATGVVFNPSWFVPASIVAESVGALMKNDPDRAAALGYVAAPDGGVRQQPGPANALGRMKLIMPNPYSVFLHDTPGREAFKAEKRALSHGCIRVDGAVGFAANLLGDALSETDLNGILAAWTTREIAFEKPLPVYIGYFTAFAGEDGRLALFEDIYGLDAALLPLFGGAAGPAPEDPIGSLIIESCPETAEGAANNR